MGICASINPRESREQKANGGISVCPVTAWVDIIKSARVRFEGDGDGGVAEWVGWKSGWESGWERTPPLCQFSIGANETDAR